MRSKAKRRRPLHRSGSDLVGNVSSTSQNASRRGSARATPTSRAPHGWIALLLIVATLAVFYPVRHHEFVDYDDAIQIVQNPQIRGGLGVTGLRRAFQPYGSNWIPLTWISYQINYAFGGFEPGGYLLTNVALHALNAALLYLALVGMTGARWRSAFVAALFALHPLHVESVAWATLRKDVLSGLFWMLTLCAYSYYCRKPRSIRRYSWVFVCLALGLMAKPMLVTLPFVLLLLDYWPLDRLRDSGSSDRPHISGLRGAVVEKLPLFGLIAASSAITFIAQREFGAVSTLESLPLGVRSANAVESYAIYVWSTFWPSGLAAIYPYPQASILRWSLALASVFLLMTSVFVARNAIARPYAMVGWLWYLGTLVPVIGFVQVGIQARADRYMYLPLIGLSILVTWGAFDLANRWRVPRPALAAMAMAILIGLGAISSDQIGAWRNSATLYQRALAVTDDNYLAHTGSGNLLLQEGRLDDAERHFDEAVRVRPGWPKARMGLADIAAARGKLDEALRIYEEELKRNPDDIEMIGRYGTTLGLAGRNAEARLHLLRALDASPGVAELHLTLSIIEAQQGNSRESLRYLREALRLSPKNVDAANNLAWLLATSHDSSLREPDEAIRLIERIALESQEPGLLDTLAAAYAAAGRFDAAVTTASRAASGAEALGDEAGASEFRARSSLYSRGEPYIEEHTDDASWAPMPEAFSTPQNSPLEFTR
jgi:tetratricopeptide (TPR) repeat protein